MQRVDVDALVERTELGSVVARSTAGVVSGALDVARSVAVSLDQFVHRWIGKLIRRQRDAASGRATPPGGADAARGAQGAQGPGGGGVMTASPRPAATSPSRATTRVRSPAWCPT